MRSHTISTDSWHYRFIQRFNSFHPESCVAPKDVCAYRGTFFRALLNCVVIYLCATGFGALPLTLLLTYVFHGFMTGYWDWSLVPASVQIWTAIIVFCALFTAIAYACQQYGEAQERKRKERHYAGIIDQPSIVSVMWQSFRQKYCVQLNFEGPVE